ncbi:hypothetical protein [Lentilactobacillus buchneri]|uniref:hypothetical protein n=1 Tax=Lentilactobacillus buchneri TaxID=1581 RepID=UPI001CDC2BC8|nr:hypothetical protein [Lentilactobacillus buchneri]
MVVTVDVVVVVGVVAELLVAAGVVALLLVAAGSVVVLESVVVVVAASDPGTFTASAQSNEKSADSCICPRIGML